MQTEKVTATSEDAMERISHAIQYLYRLPGIPTSDAMNLLARAYQAVSDSEPTCGNVLQVNSPDDIDVCGARARYFCEECEVEACSRSCARGMGCEHDVQTMDEAVAA